MNAYKGEALLCRAYSHFILANLFCVHYNSATASAELGIPYAVKPETEVRPYYERGTWLRHISIFRKIWRRGCH